MGLQAAWLLPDGTRVAVKPVTAEEWSVRVNDVEVPNRVSRAAGFANYDLSFRLPSGAAATARLRHPAGLSAWELCADGRPILYAGRQPFRCPSCRDAVEAYATECAACGAAQPSNDARLATRLRRAIVQSIATTNVFFVALGIAQIASFRLGSGAALASLDRAQVDAQFPGQFDTSTTSGLHAGELALLHSKLGYLAALMLAVFGIALLAYRAPMFAARLQCAFVALLWVLAFSSGTHVSPWIWALYAAMVWGAVRTLRAATDLRAGRYSMPPNTATAKAEYHPHTCG